MWSFCPFLFFKRADKESYRETKNHCSAARIRDFPWYHTRLTRIPFLLVSFVKIIYRDFPSSSLLIMRASKMVNLPQKWNGVLPFAILFQSFSPPSLFLCLLFLFYLTALIKKIFLPKQLKIRTSFRLSVQTTSKYSAF